MIDAIDKMIQQFRSSLHEANRQSAVQRRREKDVLSEARAKLDQIEDRVNFHIPIREQRATESNGDYKRYVRGVKTHRHQILMMIVARLAQRVEDMSGDDDRDAFVRGDW